MKSPVAAMISILALASADPAWAQRRAASCAISAYVIDRDPAGLNVRASPSGSARILTTVPNQGSAVAQIKEHRGGWFRVTSLVDAEDDATLYRGDGWIHSSLLSLSVANADPRLYTEPRMGSRVVATLVPEETEVSLIGCSGDWVRVRALGRVGWLSPGGQCSNPLTTCA